MATPVIKCTYKHCVMRFENEKDMKGHKQQEPTHHYCRKCDYDAVDWNDLLDHKIESMAPFLIGELRHEKHKKMKHLCCEFCGEDFKSLEGRMVHRRQMHQGPQQVICNATGTVWDFSINAYVQTICGEVLMSPSLLMQHYEQGRCQFVTPAQFNSERQHKRILALIFENPEMFNYNMSCCKAVQDAQAVHAPAEIDEPPSSDSNSSILDRVEGEAINIGTLTPYRHGANYMDQIIDDFESTRMSNRRGVKRSHRELPELSLRGSSPGRSSVGQDVPDATLSSRSEHASSAAGGVAVAKFFHGFDDPGVNEQDTISKTSFDVGDLPDSDSERDECETIRPQSRASSQAVSRIGTTSSIADYVGNLQQSQLHRIDWDELAARAAADNSIISAEQTPAEATESLFKSRWYDPSAAAYDPDLFYHPLLEAYKCPFAACDMTYLQQEDMEQHLRDAHLRSKNMCPRCSREFGSVSGLVRHFECSIKGSRCAVSSASDFNKLLSHVSGGFLDVEPGPKGPESRLVGVSIGADGKVALDSIGKKQGVKSMVFEGVIPTGTPLEVEMGLGSLAGAEPGRKMLMARGEVSW